MKKDRIGPDPATLISLLDSPERLDRAAAIDLLVELLQCEDKMARWGTVYVLLHTSLRQYFNLFVEQLQEGDQPEAIRSCARCMQPLNTRISPLGIYVLIRAHARMRILLYLLAGLHGQFLDDG